MVKKEGNKKVNKNKEEEIFDLVEQWIGLDDPENLEESVYKWTAKKVSEREEAPKITA